MMLQGEPIHPKDSTSSAIEVISLSYTALSHACDESKDNISMDELIDKAFGSDSLNSLGIIAITDVPTLSSLRLELLRLSQKLATLSSKELEKITSHDAGFQVGWSHGREKLEGDKLDFCKGSFYANPLTGNLVDTMLERRKCGNDADSRVDMGGCSGREIGGDIEELLQWDESIPSAPSNGDLRLLAKLNPAFFAPNIWPDESIPELEDTFIEVGQLVHRVGIMLAKCCDSYVASRCPRYEPHKLERILRHSKFCKARLLHYFAMECSSVDGLDDGDFSNWCGWHNDHGSITGLLPALYLDSDGRVVECPDATSGLYIKSRAGDLVHVRIPENSLAFQVGETMQIHSGGLLQATPHAVRGCIDSNVTRETFAVFMEPEYHTKMDLPRGRTVEDIQCAQAKRWLPSNVQTLKSRWKPGMNFGEFSNATFKAFH